MRKLMYSAAVVLSAGAVMAPAVASASVKPTPPPRPVTINVVEKGLFGRDAKAIMAWGWMVRVGPYSKYIAGEDFQQVKLPNGAFLLRYAPNGKATGMYLRSDARGSALVFGQRLATQLRVSLPERGGYEHIFTMQVQGHKIVVKYLIDSHGSLVLSQVRHDGQGRHDGQARHDARYDPTLWKLVPDLPVRR
jgi:hypothetical protein